jgi:uncharacterized protein YjbI with pentapeptide repeats/DNA-binding XRE family transcriptional regulator
MESQAKENLFPRLIKEIRTRLALTQKEFAQMFDPPVTHQSVGQWERGENAPAKKYWSQLAELAEMDVGQLYGYVEGGVTSTSSYLDEIVQKIKGLPIEALEVVTEVAAQKWEELGETKPTANKQHLVLLKKGRAAWNHWRQKNPEIQPQLGRIDLGAINLSPPEGEIGVNLRNADLRGAKLGYANLVGADLCNADLTGADLTQVNLKNANLQMANLSDANLSGSWLDSANLRFCNLSRANLREANLSEANLRQANLEEADLTLADLRCALLVETNLEKATLKKCSVYGASIWGVRLEGANQSELSTSTDRERAICTTDIKVDSLQLAYVVHSISNDPLLYENLWQRFQQEKEALECAECLLTDYGEDAPDGTRLYIDLEDKVYHIRQKGNTLKIMALDGRDRELILLVIDGKIQSDFRSGDLDNLRTLVKLEAAKKAESHQQERKKQKSMPRVQEQGKSVLSK